MDMKLNRYIYKKLLEVEYENCPWTEEDINDWITDWYKDTFQEIGMSKEGKAKSRAPPMWLAGKDWSIREKERLERKKNEEEIRDS